MPPDENERRMSPKDVFKDARQSLQDKVWSRSRFGVQEEEMESITCKWWLEASFCKQVLSATGEVGAVVFLQTSIYLVQSDEVL